MTRVSQRANHAAMAERVAEAMQAAWNDFVIDTGCYPDCFERRGRGKLSADFRRGNFAAMVAACLAYTDLPADPLDVPPLESQTLEKGWRFNCQR